MQQLVELRNKLTEKQKALAEYMASAKKDGKYDPESTLKISSVKFAEEVQTKNKELNDLGKEVATLASVEQAEVDQRLREAEIKGHPHPADDGKPGQKKTLKSLGQQFIESKAYRERPPSFDTMGPTSELKDALPSEILKQYRYASGIKTEMTRSAGWDPEQRDSGLIVLSAQRPVQALDLIPTIPTSRDTYVYMEETTFTNNAAEIAEASASTYGEAALAYTRRTQAVEKIAVYIPVSEEQLEDSAEAAALIDQRLPFMVNQRLDSQVINGSGSTPNILGVLSATGLQTQARGSDPDMDAIHKAITLSRVTGRAMPNAIVMHSNNWQYLRLLRTTDGIYILGNPADQAPPRLWGLPVAFNEAISAGTAVVGDFSNYCLLAERRGMTVDVGWINTYFIRGMKAVRATIRVAMVWTRGAAFVRVTSLQS